MNRVFSLKFTLLLCAYLVVPFAIESVTGLLTFPAVLLPVGSGKLDVLDGKVTFAHLSFWGFDRQGRPQQLDPGKFFAPIPIGYSGALAGYGLGLSEETTQPVWVRGARFRMAIPRHIPETALRDEVVAWLSDQLRKEGLSTDRIAVRRDEIIVEVKTGRKLSSSLLDERTITLR